MLELSTQAAPATAIPDPGFGLYVHWPFCLAKCPYCDFNSHVRARVDQARWAGALVAEIDRVAALTGSRRLDSIFFGGGTPSLMAPETVAAVIDRAVRRFTPAPGLEVTLEANPTSVEAGKFAGFRAAGVNRVSLGVQALNDPDLQVLGREHSAAEALEAVELAARQFERWSFDLIYARPDQTPAGWEAELRRALAWVGGHLSAYQLTIEEGTRYHALVRSGRLVPPDEEIQAELFELTQDVLSSAGLPAYEISNHAAPGEACRHNLVYWRYGTYAGIGPGAHGRIETRGRLEATAAERVPERWLALVEGGKGGDVVSEPVPREDQLLELLMMGLRLVEGVPLGRIEAIAGRLWPAVLRRDAVARLVAAGYLELTDERIRATAPGRQRLNAMLADILA
jgi:putative oxygen-independent coproporphyrinogen III oxidase